MSRTMIMTTKMKKANKTPQSPRILQSIIFAVLALAATSGFAQSDAQKAFNTIKSMPGS